MTESRRAGWNISWPVVITLIGSALVILIVMSPWWIFSATTPTGGDMGAHVFGPAYLRDNLLPEGRIIGWSNDWFAGFPAFYFYFPLPSLTIVALDLLLPYGVAFKIVTVMGLLALPPAVYFLTRSMKLGRHVSLVASATAVVFAFFESYTIYGGNVASTLAGEFSYSWSLALSLVYLGLLIKGVREDRKYLKWAALALALTALSHVLTTIVIIFASLFILPWRRGFWRTVAVWAWGFSIAAFWALPLLARIGLTSDMAWTPLSRWEEILPVEIWILLPLAIPGAVWAMRKGRRAGPMIAATLLPVIYFPLPTVLPELLPDVFDGERWKLWNGRLLPYWYFGVAFFAAIGVGAAMVWLSRRIPARVSTHLVRLLLLIAVIVASALVSVSAEFPWWGWIPIAVAGMVLLGSSYTWSPDVNGRYFLSIGATAILALGALSSVTFIDGWSSWNYEGYESKEPWPEYEALMVELDRLPEGRVQWEGNRELNKYGTPMSPMLIPYWTEGSHKSMEGLFFESSLTTPFHFINSSEMSLRASNPIPGLSYNNFDMERGIRHLELYGVRYYVSFTPEAAAKADGMEELTKVATTEPFSIYELPPTQLVEVATFVPAVYESDEGGLLGTFTGSSSTVDDNGDPLPGFHDFALEWYDDIDNLDRWVVADGPEEWPRIESVDELPSTPISGEANVTDIVLEDHQLSFTTDAVGVPHLVKISYFPNWTAEGADGPWRATPSLMVVVPTSENVVLTFERTWAENGGLVLSAVGLVALLLAGLTIRRRREDV